MEIVTRDFGRFNNWADHMVRLGFTDFLSAEDGFSLEQRTGEKWLRTNDCGVYTWVTGSGETYTGQALRARSRLKQHWKNYRDIAYAAFAPVPVELLNKEEPRLIAAVEALYPVLNIKFAQSSASVVPLDRVVSHAQMRLFMEGCPADTEIPWREFPILHRKQARRFAIFKSDELYLEAIEALRIYISRCVPLPSVTEAGFWSVTILNESPHVFRINVGQQEVFSLWVEDGLYARILAREQLDDRCFGPFYVTNSYENRIPLRNLKEWLMGERTIACRKLVIWLMRHTAPLQQGSHCPQIVRAAFSVPSALTSP
jgi:hypothetical protein